MLIPRRKLLTGVAALSAARVLGLPAEARGMGGGSAAPGTFPSPPPWAAANGLNRLTRSINFDTLDVFDLNNTCAPGFGFYMNPAWPNASFNAYWQGTSPVTPANNLTLTVDGVTLSPSSNTNQAGNYLVSACPQPGNPSPYAGFTLSGGGYVEYLAKWQIPTTSVPCPALWTVSIESMTGATITHSIELDAPESTMSGADFVAWDWTSYSPPTANSAGYFPDIGLGNIYNTYNRWGLGWLTQAQNGGVGRLDLVLNDVVVKTITYSSSGGSSPAAGPSNPNGVLSVIESQHQILLIGAGVGEPMYLGKGTAARPGHTVWQS